MSYPVGIDLGATFTAAAVCQPAGVEVVSLGARATFVPTVAAVDQEGSLVLGWEAAALGEPGRVARQFIRRVGDDTPLLLGEVSLTAEALAAKFVSFVLGMVTGDDDEPVPRVALTHPASWGAYRVTALRSALSAEGLDESLLLSTAQASAQAYADRAPVAPGDLVAVYDLGGSGLDAAVVRRLAGGEFALAGRAEEVEVGGLDFDELVFEHVRTALGEQWAALDPTDPAVLAGVARLRRACTAAKEQLSADTETWIPVAIPGIDAGVGGAVRLVRAELEEMIRPAVEETAAALLRAVSSAGVEPDDLAAVLLAGGSARIPLVTQVVSEVLGRPVTVADRPKADTVAGAALAAAGHTQIVDTPPGADAEAASTGEPTQIILRVPDAAEDEPALTPSADLPPARPRGPVLVAPEELVQRPRRPYLPHGMLAAGGLVLVALLVGGWLWMSNARGQLGAGNDIDSSVTGQTHAPATPAVSPAPSRSAPKARPSTKKARPRARPAATLVEDRGPSRSPTHSPTGTPSPTKSSTPSSKPTEPTSPTARPSPSASSSAQSSSGHEASLARTVDEIEPGSDK